MLYLYNYSSYSLFSLLFILSLSLSLCLSFLLSLLLSSSLSLPPCLSPHVDTGTYMDGGLRTWRNGGRAGRTWRNEPNRAPGASPCVEPIAPQRLSSPLDAASGVRFHRETSRAKHEQDYRCLPSIPAPYPGPVWGVDMGPPMWYLSGWPRAPRAGPVPIHLDAPCPSYLQWPCCPSNRSTKSSLLTRPPAVRAGSGT
jgi:hypothetical protein